MRSRRVSGVLPWVVTVMVMGVVLEPLPPCPGAAGAVSAEEGGRVRDEADRIEGGNTLPLSLHQSVLLALQNNPDVRIERLNPLIREEEVKKEQRVFFYPLIGYEVSLARSEQPAGSVLAGADVTQGDTFDFNTGVKTQLITGAVLSLDWKNRRFETNSVFQRLDPQYNSDLALTLTHPLLKNFGVGVNGTRIRIARNNLEISRYQVRGVVTNIVSEVQQTYWDLVLTWRDLAARRRSLEFARYLERRAEEMVAAGRLPAMAILQAQVGVKEREIDLLNGENAFKEAQERLKTLLNVDQGAVMTDLTILPVDRPPAEVRRIAVEEGLKAAMTNRPELVQARLDLESKQAALKFARNQMLPELNFVGSVGLSGLSGTPTTDRAQQILEALRGPSPFQGGYGDALESLFSGDFVSYKVGVTFQIPLGNPARSEYRKARLEEEKARFFLQRLERKIVLEVEGAARGVQTALKVMEGARSLRELAERKLKMAQEGLELGVGTVTAVLEAEKDLVVAQRDELKAIVEYNKALILWEKVTGMTLDRFNIEL